MAETNNNKWYVMKAVSGKEMKVKEYIEAEMKHNELLSRHVSQILIPMEKHAVMHGSKRVIKEKVALPGYVFVEANLGNGDIASKLRFMPNVLGFLGGLDDPTPVPQSEINRMLGQATESEIDETVDIPYVVDETVKVTDGPFNGFTGVIEEVNEEKHKLKVMVKIFGRKTPLELNYNQVEKEG
ncbi:MAG: transcription termination/antitermination protein NusG [Prevotellaceae bacterium]|nr:transcription termination/antitermination protein NusG [Prevotellaceae bacterium]